jgi:hephaestin
MLIDENQSHYLPHNIDAYTEDPKSVHRREFVRCDVDGNFHGAGIGFAAANFRASSNGYMLSNLPMPVMKRGERVRWYVMTLGGSVNIHTPHWHGNVVSYVHVVFALPRELTSLALQNKRLISTKTFQD